MTLIVEDGSVVENANSLVSRDDYIDYAASVGVTIENTEDADFQLIKALNFISSYEDRLKGTRTDRDQSAPYPRSGLRINGWAWDDDEIPIAAIRCQIELALEINSGTDLYNPVFSKGPRIEETVSGAVTVKYGVQSSIPIRTQSRAFKLLNDLLKSSGLQSIELVRA
jgi:hypothetical protein